MRVLNSVVALNTPRVLVDERLIPVASNRSAAIQTIHLSPAQWESLAILGPDEHELYMAQADLLEQERDHDVWTRFLDRGPWETAREAFLTDDDTMGLERFIQMVDEAGMSTTRSVDLMVWLTAWRACDVSPRYAQAA